LRRRTEFGYRFHGAGQHFQLPGGQATPLFFHLKAKRRSLANQRFCGTQTPPGVQAGRRGPGSAGKHHHPTDWPAKSVEVGPLIGHRGPSSTAPRMRHAGNRPSAAAKKTAKHVPVRKKTARTGRSKQARGDCSAAPRQQGEDRFHMVCPNNYRPHSGRFALGEADDGRKARLGRIFSLSRPRYAAGTGLGGPGISAENWADGRRRNQRPAGRHADQFNSHSH